MAADRKTLLAPNAAAPPVAQIRSTFILASLGALRAKGLASRYFSALPVALHDTMNYTVAGVWLPVEVGLAHYRACNSLEMTPAEQYAMGQVTAQISHGTLLGTAVRMSKAAGVTPWTILPLLGRFWERGFDGGAVGVYATGPKDARIEVAKCVLFDIEYFRNGFRAVTAGILQMFSARAILREDMRSRPAASVNLIAQWV